jgi:hypothetical protein
MQKFFGKKAVYPFGDTRWRSPFATSKNKFLAPMAALWLFVGLVCVSPAAEGPDTVVFKDGVTLPEYAPGRVLPCRVLDIEGSELTVDVSRYKGVALVRKIDKSLIAEVRLAASAKVAVDGKTIDMNPKIALQKNAAKIKLPENSQTPGYYDGIINGDIEPLLEKFADSEIVEPLTMAKRALERERQLVTLGWLRRGNTWLTPEEAKEFAGQRELWQLLDELKTIRADVRAGRTQGLSGLAGRVKKCKDDLYYPYVLDAVQFIVRESPKSAVPPDLQELEHSNIRRLLELSSRVQKVREQVDEIDSQGLSGLDLYTPLINDLVEVGKGWPNLSGLREMTERVLEGARCDAWLAAVQGEGKELPVPARMAKQVKALTDSGVISLAAGQKFQGEITAAVDFWKKTAGLRAQKKWGEMAALKLPAVTAEIAPAQEALAAVTADAQARMTKAGQKLAECRAAYDAKNFADATETAAAAVAAWPDNPQAKEFYDRLVDDFGQALGRGKKGREYTQGILKVLQAGWPSSPRVAEFHNDLNRERDFFAFFDNFSMALISVIAFCVVLGFFALKYMAKLFSD